MTQSDNPRPTKRHLVILVHGIQARASMMRPLAKAFRDYGENLKTSGNP